MTKITEVGGKERQDNKNKSLKLTLKDFLKMSLAYQKLSGINISRTLRSNKIKFLNGSRHDEKREILIEGR